MNSPLSAIASHSSSLKVIHFVTGGFTGSTKVAIELIRAAKQNPALSSMLVLRKKSSTDMAQVQQLQRDGIALKLVAGWSHAATIIELIRICKEYQPDILVTHGFSEHLWGRYAGLLARVPHLIHVEHNSRERYTPLRLLQARWLAQHTDNIIGCSEGVRQRLLELQFPPEKISAINNGIDLTPYTATHPLPLEERIPGIVMPARFAKQKDHETLIRAIALLREKNIFPSVFFAGAGSKRHIARAQKLVDELQLNAQIHFAGHCGNLPFILMRHQICVLSTRYEGMPLALAEGMASGCAVVGSAVTGVKEMIHHGKDGLLVKPQCAHAMADALEIVLTNSSYAQILATQGRERALAEFSLARMAQTYEQVFFSLQSSKKIAHSEQLILEN
ncbi:glycosyltransferase [Cellvibrio sp. pealriver]|uniref:glycosyltransferase n=1 Tax=Cellvibrio sp. pealriver TaxID=1622269 RepID=UPI00066FBDA8|nr:glycosyltransferase [Cellvibrio sp. pealriver]